VGSRLLTCYPQPGKAKSREVLAAFAAGCGGRLSDRAELAPGAAAFFGVVGIEHLLRLAIADGREFYYGDNAFFDTCRGTHFRFAKNAVQSSRLDNILWAADLDRLRATGVRIEDWRRRGRSVIVVEQSEHYLNLVGQKHWLLRILLAIEKHTDRPIKVRRWSRDKAKMVASFQQDLREAWAVVTHTSAAAVTALCAGVPVFVSGACAASPLASGDLEQIERPRYPEGREAWAAGLAGMQWTLDELRAGMAARLMMREIPA
jgi:hypothetical protein